MPRGRRRGYGRIVAMPPTTDRTIVFPYNFSSKKFITQHYFPGMTNNSVSSEEINQFLGEVERQLIPYHEAAGQNVIRLMTVGICVLFIAAAITIPVSIVSMASKTESRVNSTPTYVSGYGWKYPEEDSSSNFPIAIPIVFGILFCYVLLFIVMNWRYSTRGAQKLIEVKQNISVFIGQRAGDYKERGLNWALPINFPYWIELWRTEAMGPLPNFFNGMGMMQQTDPFNNSMAQPFNMNDTSRLYSNNVSVSMQPVQMQQMQMQMQPMQLQPLQMQVQPQQGIYMQNQYGFNTYGNYGGIAT